MISKLEYSKLIDEIKFYCLFDFKDIDIVPSPDNPIETIWINISIKYENEFKSLIRVAFMLMTFPHSTAELERIFSELSNIKTIKRNKLDIS